MGVDTKWLAKQQETQMDNPCLELWYEQRIEELIAERDEAWKRAGHAEEMWGKAEAKLSESEALLAKAVEWTEKVQKYAISWDDKYLAERSNEILAELTGEQK